MMKLPAAMDTMHAGEDEQRAAGEGRDFTALARDAHQRMELHLERIEVCAEHARYRSAQEGAHFVREELLRESALEEQATGELASRLDDPLAELLAELRGERQHLWFAGERLLAAAEVGDAVLLRSAAADLRGMLAAHLSTVVEDISEPLLLLEGGDRSTGAAPRARRRS